MGNLLPAIGRAALASTNWPHNLKAVPVALAIAESGHGSDTWVAANLANYWSLKNREELGLPGRLAPDGYFYSDLSRLTMTQRVDVLWHFLHRSPYPEIDRHLADPRDFLEYFLRLYNGQGWYPEWIRNHGGINYGDYVLSFLAEADALQRSLGWSGPTQLPPPAPVVLPPLGNFALVGDRLVGALWNPVKNFDRFRVDVQKIFIHFAAALGEGVMDAWSNPWNKYSATFYGMRDGRLFQCVPLNFAAWSVSGWNTRSISFELENLGCFAENEHKATSWYDPKTDTFNRWYWPGIVKSAPKSEFVLLRHPKEYRFLWWHTYTPAQIGMLRRAVPVLVAGEPRHPQVLGHEDVEAQKVDPGPAFPWAELRAAL